MIDQLTRGEIRLSLASEAASSRRPGEERQEQPRELVEEPRVGCVFEEGRQDVARALVLDELLPAGY